MTSWQMIYLCSLVSTLIYLYSVNEIAKRHKEEGIDGIRGHNKFSRFVAAITIVTIFNGMAWLIATLWS